jgi:hypothetical protein
MRSKFMQLCEAILYLGIVASSAYCADAEKPKEAAVVDRREAARRVACAQNLRQIGTALMMFADVPENDVKYPARLSQLFNQYIADKRIFLCPSATEHGAGEGTIDKCDYVYIPGSKPDQATNVLAFCCKKHHQGAGRNVLDGMGAVQFLNDEQFKKTLEETLKTLNISLEIPVSKPLSDAEIAQAKKAIDDLGDNDFKVRDAAAKLIEKLGEGTKPLLEEGLKSADAERAARCKELIVRTTPTNVTLVKALRAELDLDKVDPAKK